MDQILHHLGWIKPENTVEAQLVRVDFVPYQRSRDSRSAQSASSRFSASSSFTCAPVAAAGIDPIGTQTLSRLSVLVINVLILRCPS